MKFTMGIEKHQGAAAGRCAGHNLRTHQTASQLPPSAWITQKGGWTVAPWKAERLDAARGIAKRKDAVVAIELVIQVGNQTDWREPPTAEHPHGKPRRGSLEKIKALAAGAIDAATREFGKANIVGINVHTDESTPHVHIVATPIREGKLQAKHWTGGAAACAALRSRIHAAVNARIACDYTRGGPGGAPHDPLKAAGGLRAPKPAPNIIGRVKGALDASSALREARQRIAELELQVQGLFSQMKAAQADTEMYAKAADRAQARYERAAQEIRELRQQVANLTPTTVAPDEPAEDFAADHIRPAPSKPKHQRLAGPL